MHLPQRKMKHALVIGGSRGLGGEVCSTLIESGWTVSSIARSRPEATPPEGLSNWVCDITDDSATNIALKDISLRRGQPDAVIFCHRFRGETLDLDGELGCSVTATAKAINLLTSDPDFGPASIVIVSSVASTVIAPNTSLAYHVAKAAMVQLARHFAVLLGPRRIRVNTVSPATFVKREAEEWYSKKPALLDAFSKTIPLGRLCSAREVAHAIEFFASDKASFITGQNLVVDGGVTLLNQESLARHLSGGI